MAIPCFIAFKLLLIGRAPIDSSTVMIHVDIVDKIGLSGIISPVFTLFQILIPTAILHDSSIDGRGE